MVQDRRGSLEIGAGGSGIQRDPAKTQRVISEYRDFRFCSTCHFVLTQTPSRTLNEASFLTSDRDSVLTMSEERPARPVRGVVAEKRRALELLKEQPAAKRRVSGTPSSIKAEKKARAVPISAASSPTKEEEEVVVIPSKIVDGQPLPTLKEPQSKTLSDSEYKSIVESGVLAESVERSRKRWTHDIFEKYWSKTQSRLKKNMTEEEKKADAERKAQLQRRGNMTRFGECKLIVEPHIFDVSLFIVKETTMTPPIQSTSQQFVQYGPQYGNSGTPTPSYASSPFRPSPLQQTSTMPAPETPRPSVQPPQAPPATEPRNTAAQPAPKNVNVTPRNPPPTPKPQSAPPAPQPQRPDPVIHMLAQRAATDHELKSVMTIVATGKASAQQLEFFQKHIDELTKIARANEEAERRRNAAKAAPPAPPTPTPAPPSQTTNGQPQSASPVNTRPSTPSQNHQPISQPHTQVQPQPRQPHPNQYTYQHAAPKLPKPTLQAQYVIMEFSSNSNDRFLFPRYSILEFLRGMTSCLVSFLVVRKINKATGEIGTFSHGTPTPVAKKGKKEEPEKEVYQPITVKFSAAESKMLTMLAQVVAPQEEVRKYMEDVMARAERAKEGVLVMRLPRRKRGVGVDSGEDS